MVDICLFVGGVPSALCMTWCVPGAKGHPVKVKSTYSIPPKPHAQIWNALRILQLQSSMYTAWFITLNRCLYLKTAWESLLGNGSKEVGGN